MKRISFQGERGAYSEATAISFFGENVETIPLPTFAEVLEHTSSGKADYSIFYIDPMLEDVNKPYQFVLESLNL